MLSAEQEKFCQLRALEMSATQSYMQAFGIDNARSAATLGSRELKKVEIVNRINEIRKQSSKGVAMTLDEMHEHINEIVRDKEQRAETMLKAMELSAKLQGLMKQTVDLQGELVTTVEMVGDIDA